MRISSYSTKCLYHIFNRGNRKKKIFYSERDYTRFLTVLDRSSAKCLVKIAVKCLMPNHYHLAVVLVDGGSIPRFMQRLGIAYTKYVNTRYRLVGHVFQGKYQAKKVTTTHGIDRLIRYIKENPVKEGLVVDSKYYRWLEIQSGALEDIKTKIGVAKNVDTDYNFIHPILKTRGP